MSDDASRASDPRLLWREAQRAVDRVEPQRGAPSTSPVGRYLDPLRHAREVAALRRLPHAIGPASRLMASGDWFSTQVLGVPVLATRGSDGEVRAFVNVCRHRGSLVVPSAACGAGKARFVCPYHSWTYDDRGALVGRPHDADFAHVAREAASLVPLPVAIRLGLVWVVPEAFADFNWADWFGPLADELDALGYAAGVASPHERRFVQPSNWKLVLDANLESYHFQYAHRATIAHLFHDNVVQQASFGRHQRIVLPKRSLADSVRKGSHDDDVDWDRLGRHSNIIYFFFPSTFVLWEGDHANVFNVTPETVASCATASWMIVPGATHARRDATHWSLNWKIFWDAIDEDFALAASMQPAWRAAPTRRSRSARTSSPAICSSALSTRSSRSSPSARSSSPPSWRAPSSPLSSAASRRSSACRASCRASRSRPCRMPSRRTPTPRLDAILMLRKRLSTAT